ncbi:MAG: YrhA family protein [Clostridiales Family XIII bacterium]|nr:YrhA family protein [Clostridiales Family XIII bacterium]
MNDQIKDLLDKIEEAEKEFGSSIFAQNEKTNENEIACFEKWISNYCENGFSEYVELMKLINGLNNNGLYIYSLDKKSEYNVYEENETLWYDNEDFRDYIFFGDDSISWYCLNKKDGNYYILDKPSGTIMDEYKLFDEVIIEALKTALGTDDE